LPSCHHPSSILVLRFDEIGNRLKAFRLGSGLAAEEIAQKLGISCTAGQGSLTASNIWRSSHELSGERLCRGGDIIIGALGRNAPGLNAAPPKKH